MASLLWTKNQNCNKPNPRAPSSIFSSNNNLSPRQVATKACNLAIKKLDRDDKRSRPQYNVRERLLLCNTLSNAEKFLQKRTLRTNRRVMAFEEEEDDDYTVGSPMEGMIATPTSTTSQPSSSSSSSSSSIDLQDSFTIHHHYDQPTHHSPLCHIEVMNDGEENEQYVLNHQTTTTYSQQQQQHQQEEHDAQYMTLEMALQSKSHHSSIGSGALVIPQDDEDDYDHQMTPTYLHHQQQQPQFMTFEMALQSASYHSPMSNNNAFVIPQDDEDFLQYPPSFLIPNNPTINNNNNNNNGTNVLTSECRPLGHQNPHTSPIASII